jgi:hypothetical protein
MELAPRDAQHLVEASFSCPPALAPLTDVPVMFSMRHERNLRDQSGLSLPGGAVIRRSRNGHPRLARKLFVRLGHVRRPSQEHGQVLFPDFGWGNGIQAAVRKCVERASCQRQPLIAAGRIRLSCRHAFAKAAAIRRFTSEFAKELSLCSRGHAVCDNGE